MKYVSFLLLSLVVLSSCWHVQPVCRHNALYSAVTAGEIYPVRIARGVTRGEFHAQAQAWHNGQWKWIDVGIRGIVFVKVNDFEVLDYYTAQEYFQRLEHRVKGPGHIWPLY